MILRKKHGDRDTTMMLFFIPEWLTGFNFLLALVGFLVLIGAALILLLAKHNANAREAQLDVTEAQEGLLQLRSTELGDCQKKCAKCGEELESLTVEYRALAGIVIKDLFNYWQRRDQELVDKESVLEENRILKLRMQKYGEK